MSEEAYVSTPTRQLCHDFATKDSSAEIWLSLVIHSPLQTNKRNTSRVAISLVPNWLVHHCHM